MAKKVAIQVYLGHIWGLNGQNFGLNGMIYGQFSIISSNLVVPMNQKLTNLIN